MHLKGKGKTKKEKTTAEQNKEKKMYQFTNERIGRIKNYPTTKCILLFLSNCVFLLRKGLVSFHYNTKTF